MSLRLAFVAAIGLIGFAGPALAVMQEIHIPDPNAPAQNGGPPDGLYDKSVPDQWQSKTDSDHPNAGNSFHFTMSGSNNGYGQTGTASGFSMSGSSGGFNEMGTTSAYDIAKRPGSEFYQPGPQYTGDPLFGQ